MVVGGTATLSSWVVRARCAGSQISLSVEPAAEGTVEAVHAGPTLWAWVSWETQEESEKLVPVVQATSPEALGL